MSYDWLEAVDFKEKASHLALTRHKTLVAQDPVKKPIEFLAASRQYSQAVLSHDGGVWLFSAEPSSDEELSCFNFARKIKNGLNVNSRVW